MKGTLTVAVLALLLAAATLAASGCRKETVGPGNRVTPVRTPPPYQPRNTPPPPPLRPGDPTPRPTLPG